MKIKVTKWHYPPRGPYLVLDGSPDETREEAKQYFDDHESLQFIEAEMEREEFDKLKEFEP